MAGSVSQWNDKSGNSHHAIQATAASQPATGAQTLNGRNVLTFNSADFFSFSGLPTTASIFIVTKLDAISSYTFFSRDGSGGTERFFPLATSGSSSTETYRLGTGANPNLLVGGGNIVSVPTRNDIYTAIYNAGNATISLFTGNTGNSINRIGSGPFGINFNGQLGEIIVFNYVLANADMNKLGNYLANKWSIAWTSI